MGYAIMAVIRATIMTSITAKYRNHLGRVGGTLDEICPSQSLTTHFPVTLSCFFPTWVLAELRIFPEPAPRNVASNEDGADDTANDAEQQEWKELDEDPGVIVLDVKEDRVLVPERVYGLQDERSNQRAEKRSPEGLQREVVTNFLKAEIMEKKLRTLPILIQFLFCNSYAT